MIGRWILVLDSFAFTNSTVLTNSQMLRLRCQGTPEKKTTCSQHWLESTGRSQSVHLRTRSSHKCKQQQFSNHKCKQQQFSNRKCKQQQFSKYKQHHLLSKPNNEL